MAKRQSNKSAKGSKAGRSDNKPAALKYKAHHPYKGTLPKATNHRTPLRIMSESMDKVERKLGTKRYLLPVATFDEHRDAVEIEISKLQFNKQVKVLVRNGKVIAAN